MSEVNFGYILSPIVATVITIGLIIIVRWKGTHGYSSRLFQIVLFSIALWNILTIGMRISTSTDQALLWARAISIPGFATWVCFYHFTIIITREKRQRFVLVLATLLLITVIVISQTDFLITDMRLEPYGYAVETTTLGLLLFGAGFVFIGLAIFNLARESSRSSYYEEKNRLTFLMYAAVLPLIGGGLDGFTNLPPAGIWANLVFCGISSIALMKYHLFDVRVVIRRGITYILVSLIVAAPFVGAIIALGMLVNDLEINWYFIPVVIMAAFALRPLYVRAQICVDKLFYRDRYDSFQALSQLSQKTQDIRYVPDLVEDVAALLVRALKFSRVSILLEDSRREKYVTVACAGCEDMFFSISFRKRSTIVEWLNTHPEILDYEQLNIEPVLQSFSAQERNVLNEFEAQLIVPIVNRSKQLLGIILLGKRVDARLITWEDTNLLTTVTNQISMVLDNAKLLGEMNLEINERRQVENDLRKSEERYRLLAENAKDIIYKITLNSGLKFDYVSPSALRVTGFSPQDFYDDPYLLTKNIYRGYRHLIERAFQTQEVSPEPFMMQYVRKDGETIWLESSNNVYQGENHTIIEGIARDVTARKAIEDRERLLQAELYQTSRLASLGKLAAGVAHEINNPLTAIVGFSQYVKMKSTDNRFSEELGIIHDEAMRTSKIVKNLLTFAREKQPLREVCDVNDILKRSLSLRSYELKSSGIELEMKLAKKLPTIWADSNQIQEVFLNLILNAEDALEAVEGQRILAISTIRTDENVEIIFSDTGHGMSQRVLDRIFDPFYTTKGDRGGTGLGLSICHGIISEHHGRIKAHSVIDEGTEFRVLLLGNGEDDHL